MNTKQHEHQTFTFCSNCKADLTSEEVSNNECWTCGETLFNVPSSNPKTNEYDTEINDEIHD